MPLKSALTSKFLPAKTFEVALDRFRSQQFDVREAVGVADQVEIHKYDCGAVFSKSTKGVVQFVVEPGCMIAGEIASLVDHGYQKFLETKRVKIAATAERLHALHAFKEEINAILGARDYYNMALGTVSNQYLYDRLKGREAETPEASDAH